MCECKFILFKGRGTVSMSFLSSLASYTSIIFWAQNVCIRWRSWNLPVNGLDRESENFDLCRISHIAGFDNWMWRHIYRSTWSDLIVWAPLSLWGSETLLTCRILRDREGMKTDAACPDLSLNCLSTLPQYWSNRTRYPIRRQSNVTVPWTTAAEKYDAIERAVCIAMKRPPSFRHCMSLRSYLHIILAVLMYSAR